jgi:hypothetical protein
MRGVSERCFGTVLTVRVEVQEECWTCMYKEAKQQLKQLKQLIEMATMAGFVNKLRSCKVHDNLAL